MAGSLCFLLSPCQLCVFGPYIISVADVACLKCSKSLQSDHNILFFQMYTLLSPW